MDAIVEIEPSAHLIMQRTKIIYKAVVSTPSRPNKKYFGIAETIFNDHFRNYARDFHYYKH